MRLLSYVMCYIKQSKDIKEQIWWYFSLYVLGVPPLGVGRLI